MIIYRVENNKGKGFYHDGFYANFPPVQYWYHILKYATDEAQTLFISTVHPRTEKDIEQLVYDSNSNWIFGFSNEKEMNDWFPEFILEGVIAKLGKISQYIVDDKYVKILNKQCVFDISKAVLIK
jgi:hypothetical protein